MVTPPTLTGSRSACGVRAPVRPTFTMMSVRRVRAEGELLLARVHLYDDPVDLVPKRSPLARPVRALLGDRLYVFVHRVRVDAQPVASERVECGRVALVPLAALADAVAEDRQGPLGGDTRVQLPDGARRQVARVGERPLPLCLLAPVELLEPVQRDVDLASCLQHLGVVAREPLWDGPNGPQVGRDVLPNGAVAPRGSSRETAPLVAQGDREPVYLQLGDVAGLLVVSE